MSSIKVAVRCRPLFEHEKPASGLDIQSRRILLDSKTYDPDFTFPPGASQEELFQAACRPILESVKDGLNGTIMVYGQTGTGKTFTMLGAEGGDNGLVHKVIAHMLEHVQRKSMEGAQCALTLSMIEIYNEKLTDMLSPNGDEEVTLIGGFPRSTNRVTLCRVADANAAIGQGLAWRHTAATMMNERSSRSHVVFIVDLEELNAFTGQVDVAHLFMVDLAGSESLKKSQATGTAAGEAGKINKSLLALKSVLLVLGGTTEATRPAHVPYRDSKLTELLQDSIGGSARTLMIACISSVGRDIEETKSTLLYAVKARSIRNAANTEREKLQIRLRSLEVDNQKLRNRLQERVNERGGYYMVKEEYEAHQAMEDELKELRDNVEQLMRDRQSTEAHKHISESQQKVLKSLVEDKEAELQAFKQSYHDALARFERNGTALQHVVRQALARVRSAVEGGSRDSYERLEQWRAQALERILAPLPDALLHPAGDDDGSTDTAGDGDAPGNDNEEKESGGSGSGGDGGDGELSSALPLSQQQQQHLQRYTVSGSAPPPPLPLAPSRAASPSFVRPSSARESAAGGHASARPSGVASVNANINSGSSPERRRGARSHRRQASEAANAVSSPLFPPPPRPQQQQQQQQQQQVAVQQPPAVTTADFFAESDATVRRAVRRINRAFAELTGELLDAHALYREQLTRAEAERRERAAALRQELRAGVEAGLARLERLETGAEADAAMAHDHFAGRLRVAAARPPPADCAVFAEAARTACLAAARDAALHFPPAEAPPEVLGQLDGVVGAYQGTLNAMVARSLTVLSSSAVPAPTAATAAAAVAGKSSEAQQLLASLDTGASGSGSSSAVGGGGATFSGLDTAPASPRTAAQRAGSPVPGGNGRSERGTNDTAAGGALRSHRNSAAPSSSAAATNNNNSSSSANGSSAHGGARVSLGRINHNSLSGAGGPGVKRKRSAGSAFGGGPTAASSARDSARRSKKEHSSSLRK